MMLSLLTLAALTILAPSAGLRRLPAPERPQIGVEAQRRLDDLGDWIEHFRSSRRPLSRERQVELSELLRSSRKWARESGATRRELVILLLELHASGSLAEADRDPLRSELGGWVLGLAEREFRWLRSDELVRWLVSSVLVARGATSPGARAAAIELLRGDPLPELLLGLSTCARDPERIVRDAALRGLAGWDDESVHRLFALLLEPPAPADEGARPDPQAEAERARRLGAAERHFRQVRLAPESRATAPLTGWVEAHILSEDWREAARAMSLGRALPDASAIPILILALESWMARSETGAPVRRSLSDLAEALSERSGRRLGLHPERWKRWWEVVQAGDISTAEARAAAQEGARTKASFYGLRPETERVIFVIDRSTSMQEAVDPLEPDSISRYEQAVEQLLAFLQALGPNARFNVLLFSSRTEPWRAQLQPAKASTLREAEDWLNRHKPKGGTNLQPAIERAFELDRQGLVDLEALEADTIIVLCDGATAEHGHWVAPFLERVLPPTHMLIHGVQLGAGGDGTLEALARLSGGDFVTVP